MDFRPICIIRDEIFPLIGRFPLFCHFCNFPRSVIKFGVGGGGGGLVLYLWAWAEVFRPLIILERQFSSFLLDFNLIPDVSSYCLRITVKSLNRSKT